MPLPRRQPSFTELRARRLLNNNRLRNALPERRYLDFGYIHLQYYRGSIGSIGYERYRRSYRGRSQYNH